MDVVGTTPHRPQVGRKGTEYMRAQARSPSRRLWWSRVVSKRFEATFRSSGMERAKLCLESGIESDSTRA
jgi:hypothetical protein